MQRVEGVASYDCCSFLRVQARKMSEVVYKNYEPVSQRQALKIGVAVHTLGQQFVDDNSENHVTINFLLGSGLSVRVDMQMANDENLGRLLLEGRDQTRSDTTIQNVDIKASGWPLQFNPAAQPQTTVACPTVQQFVNLILNPGLHRFRFYMLRDTATAVDAGCEYTYLLSATD